MICDVTRARYDPADRDLGLYFSGFSI